VLSSHRRVDNSSPLGGSEVVELINYAWISVVVIILAIAERYVDRRR
jgi:hypothetical protein